MSKFSASRPTFTTSAIADTTNLTTLTFLALLGGAATCRFTISEIYVGGQAATSAPQYLVVARDSTVTSGVTSNDVRTAALDAHNLGYTTPPIGTSVGSSTLPQRSATLHLLNLTFNAFGGVVRWVAAPGSEINCSTASASLGEVSLSGYTGTTAGLVGAHMIYEPA